MTELATLAAFGFPLETALEGGMVVSIADAALLFASQHGRILICFHLLLLVAISRRGLCIKHSVETASLTT
jgi:hypothetical protein